LLNYPLDAKKTSKKDKYMAEIKGYIAVPGGRVWYKIVGKKRPGIPLLVIHGGPGASHDYLQPIEDLAKERPVIFYDQLGCGNSDKPDDASLWKTERFVDELQKVIETLGLNKVHLLGQSWGSSLAVEYLLTKKPTAVQSLIMSGPLLSASRWIKDQRTHIEQLSVEVRRAIEKGEKSGQFDSAEYQNAMMVFYKKHVCRLEEWPEYLNDSFAKINQAQYEYMWGPSEFTVTGTLKNYERIEQLHEIKLPVLFTCGEYDEATPATTHLYQQNLPGSQIHIIKNTSHEHHIENPQEYLNILREFIASTC
jgi:proline iminopeptidase